MIKTEAKRITIISCEQRVPPKEVLEAMQRYDSALELIWNNDDSRWEIYRLKHKGITRNEDILCWQMSAPEKGTGITCGIIDWLRKFDTSPNGSISKEELEKRWCQKVKVIFENEKLRQQKLIDIATDNFQPFIKKVEVQRKQIVVPRTVGFNKKTKKKIYMVKR